MTQTHQVLVHLNLVPGIGSVTISSILERVSLADVYDYHLFDWTGKVGLSAHSAQLLVDGLAKKDDLNRELALVDRHSFALLTIEDSDYPPFLREIYAPPPVLYISGTPDVLQTKMIAFVGSRKADQYAQQVIARLIPDLVKKEWTVVSGGARGADALAHEESLKACGKTIVVLGSGLLCPYPQSHRPLFNTIIENGGVVLSPFPLTMNPLAGNFPARNRIIAGLSRGTVVVQAAEKSGALITARYALEQGRELFAVPGTIDNELSVGCHQLIKQGAKLVENAQDILIEFGESIELGGVEEVQAQPVSVPGSLEERIVMACKTPQSIDDLADHTDLPLAELYPKLFDLQCKGSLRQNEAGLFETCGAL